MNLFSRISNSKNTQNSMIKHATSAALAAAFVLLIPLTAMQITNEVNWGLLDFTAAWILIFGAVLTFLLISGRIGNKAYRIGTGIAVATALFLIWANLAVGIIGSEDNPANLMFIGVLGIGVTGAIIARLRPAGMSYALIATAFTHAIVTLIALTAGLSDEVIGTREIIIPNGIFILLWIASALLFRKAASLQHGS